LPNSIEPVASLEALTEVYTAVLESGGPPVAIERTLDGVSRFPTARTPQFDALTQPIAARAEKFLNTPSIWPVSGPFDGRFDPRHALSALALAWMQHLPVKPVSACHGLCSFLTARVAELAVNVLNGHAKPLASLPTHDESWIEPGVLVTRLHQNPEPSRLDLIQALLRLHTDGREQALEHARSLPGPTGRIVRFALGSDDCRRPPRFYDAALWEAAGQARDPEGGAGVHRPHWSLKTHQFGGKTHKRLEVTMESWPPPHMASDRPAALTAIPGTQDAAMLRWCSTVWPAHREAWFAAGALALARNLDAHHAEWANRVYLETLAAHRSPYGPMARQLLALGLAALDTGEVLAAANALHAALQNGLITAKQLSQTCAQLTLEARIPAKRWKKRLPAHES